MLEIKKLFKKYQTGDLAINGVDLSVEKGQVMALIGPSGAGKSTLIRCVNRLENPTSGEIWLNGENIVKMRSGKLRRARRSMGMIFQEYALVERLTVMENVLSGRLGYVSFWRSFFRKFHRWRLSRYPLLPLLHRLVRKLLDQLKRNFLHLKNIAIDFPSEVMV